MSNQHIVILGDSIFDNGAYSAPEADVVEQLRRVLPPEWRATNCAKDGATTATLGFQVATIPSDATYLVVSVGGNDALAHSDILTDTKTTGVETLRRLADLAQSFATNYMRVLTQVLARKLPVSLCTIYNGDLDADAATQGRAALAIFNDCIYRAANRLGLPVIELREVCTERADYFMQIEPSGAGGRKIAGAILSHLLNRGMQTGGTAAP